MNFRATKIFGEGLHSAGKSVDRFTKYPDSHTAIASCSISDLGQLLCIDKVWSEFPPDTVYENGNKFVVSVDIVYCYTY